ncbi:hypothetical protein AVEN_122747-1 [Araneus ventricosus]|uniref:Uncharacterized protein n=1 Tax=Araneus ventricosus TaxID=182803 RepID=A0A4Y2NBD9_ARAVE|nr:hypothetical protein AVEN_122747-1 [Araneus ventricosus]
MLKRNFNPLIPKIVRIDGRQNTGTFRVSLLKVREIPFPSSKTTMTAGTVRILRKPSFSPNPSGGATLKKKVSAAGEKAITLNEKGWKFRSNIQTSRKAIVFCFKRRLGRFRIDRVNQNNTFCANPTV